MAPKGQQPQHAPHLMHFSVSMTWGIRIWPEMASMGHCRIHLPQPLHNSGSMWSSFFRPLQWGQCFSTTWARYSSRKYFRVLCTGLQADWPRPHRAVSVMVLDRSSSRSRSSRLPLVVHDAGEDLQHPAGALPAGDALAAGLVLGEVHKETGHFHHAGVLIHDHQAAGADHGPPLFRESKSRGISRCSSVRQPPEGPPICTALNSCRP